MRRRFDLLMAATTILLVTIFFVWQFFLIERAAEARLSGRAMHLRVEVSGAILIIWNHDSAFFRGCSAIVNREYRSGRQFALGPENAGNPEARLSLAEFHSGDRLLDWRGNALSRLEVQCAEFAEVNSAPSSAAAINLDALSWTLEPARWVGRL